MIVVSDFGDVLNYQDGEVIERPFTTQQKLMAESLFPDPIPSGDFLLITVGYYVDVDDFPSEGTLIIHDMEMSRTREGLLNTVNKVILFNGAFALFGGFLVVLISPWVSLRDFRPKK